MKATREDESGASDGLRNVGAPTRVRHWVVAATALAAVLLYLDRFCISFAEIYIKEDLGLSDVQVSWMLSAFFWTYALAQVPSGWFSDRFGSRPMMTLYILLWSLFTALTGLIAFSFVVLMLLRFGFGLAQAGAYPTSANILSKWVPFSNRGLASSMVAVGGRVGGVLAFALTGTLILWFVPVGVSSLLGEGDILDVPRLSYALAAHERSEPQAAGERLGATLLPGFSSPAQDVVRQNAERYEDALRRALEEARIRRQPSQPAWKRYFTIGYWRPAKKNDLQLGDVLPKHPPPAAGDVAALREELNRVIRESRELVEADVLADVPLEPEAVRLRDRQRRGEPLAPPQLERLNRLVLQAVYGDSIRKIYGAGWRPVMTAFGLAGLVVAGLFWLAHRERPERHPRCNAAEVELIEYRRPHAALARQTAVGAVPIVRLVTSRSMWFVCLSQWFTNIGWVFLVTWLPRYLRAEHHVSVEWLRWLTMLPLLFGWAGMLFGGRLTDWLARRVGLRWGRALPLATSRFLAMMAYLFCLLEPSLPLVIAAFALVAFATDLGTGSLWAFNQDVGGRYVGSILGWGNMWGNLGAAVAPPLMIAVIGPDYDWSVAFVVCALAFFLSGLVALGIDATKPIDQGD